MQHTNGSVELPARTHAEAAALLRRPFAPGAIGFRAMTKVPYNENGLGGAQVAAYLGGQSMLQRLNAVVPGRWRQEFRLLEPQPGAKRVYMICRLKVTLPVTVDGPDVEAVYEDVGEMDSGSLAGLKALYSDARKRAAVAAGIGAYLYTALASVVLPIGTGDRHVQLIRRDGRADVLALSPATEQWLRHGYQHRVSTDAVRRDLGEILAHGEPVRDVTRYRLDYAVTDQDVALSPKPGGGEEARAWSHAQASLHRAQRALGRDVPERARDIGIGRG